MSAPTPATMADLLRLFLENQTALRSAAECAERYPEAGAIYLGAMAYHAEVMDSLLSRMRACTATTCWELYARLNSARMGKVKHEAKQSDDAGSSTR